MNDKDGGGVCGSSWRGLRAPLDYYITETERRLWMTWITGIPTCSPRHNSPWIVRRKAFSFSRLIQVQGESPQLRMALANARSMVNPTFICNNFIVSDDLDFFFIQSWINAGDWSLLSELVPRDFTCFNNPRPTGQGGGLATVYKNIFNADCWPLLILLAVRSN